MPSQSLRKERTSDAHAPKGPIGRAEALPANTNSRVGPLITRRSKLRLGHEKPKKKKKILQLIWITVHRYFVDHLKKYGILSEKV